jgi:hypothetical protein
MSAAPSATEPTSRPDASGPPSAVQQATRDPSVIVLAAMLVITAAVLLLEARDTTFVLDDWQMVTERRGWGPGTFLTPHNEHLILAPVAIYKALLLIFGAGSYLPFLLVTIALHLTACTLLYVYARPRIGQWAALAPTAILLLLGPAWNDLLWAFQMTYFGSIAAGVGMLLALDRRDRTGDIVACVLLAVSLSFGGVGLGFVVVAGLELLLRIRSDGTDGWKRLWVVAVPVVLFGIWYLAYGHSTTDLGQIDRIPRFVADSLSAAMASLTGVAQIGDGQPDTIPFAWGRPLAVIFVLALAFTIWRRRNLSPRLVGLMAAPLALWILTALSNSFGRDPASSRYQYIGAIFILLIVVTVAAGWRPTRITGAILTAVTAAIVIANMVDPATAPAALFPIIAGKYLDLPDRARPYAATPEEIFASPVGDRIAADHTLAEVERIGVTGVPAIPENARCARLPVRDRAVEFPMPPGTYFLRSIAGGSLQLRRFAPVFHHLRFALPARTIVQVVIPADRLERPFWRARVTTGQRALAVCRTT